MRIGAARWLRRWFLGSDSAVGEPEAVALKETELQTTPEGQVLQMPGEKSLVALNKEWEARLKPKREQLWQNKKAALAEVRRISRIRPLQEIPEPGLQRGRKQQQPGYTVEQVILKPDSGVWLPALRYEPAAARRKGIPLLYLHHKGKQAAAAPGKEIEKLVLSGTSVFAVDLSGTGETERPAGKTPEGVLLGANNREATLAYLLGRSIAAMRAEDVLVCARHLLEAHTEGAQFTKVGVLAVGDVAVAALHAAALEPRLFDTLTIRESLSSWTDVVRTPASLNQRCSVIFGALEAYDLSDLAASLPAGTLNATDPKNADGTPQR